MIEICAENSISFFSNEMGAPHGHWYRLHGDTTCLYGPGYVLLNTTIRETAKVLLRGSTLVHHTKPEEKEGRTICTVRLIGGGALVEIVNMVGGITKTPDGVSYSWYVGSDAWWTDKLDCTILQGGTIVCDKCNVRKA